MVVTELPRRLREDLYTEPIVRSISSTETVVLTMAVTLEEMTDGIDHGTMAAIPVAMMDDTFTWITGISTWMGV